MRKAWLHLAHDIESSQFLWYYFTLCDVGFILLSYELIQIQVLGACLWKPFIPTSMIFSYLCISILIFLKLACWFPIPIVTTNKVKHSLTPETLRGSAVLIFALLLEDYWTLGPDDSWDVGTDRSLRNFLVQSPAQIVRGDPTGWVSWPRPNSWWAVTVGTWSLSADFHFQGLCVTLFMKFLPVIELTGMWLKVVFATPTVS